jgi:hypothetical protein
MLAADRLLVSEGACCVTNRLVLISPAGRLAALKDHSFFLHSSGNPRLIILTYVTVDGSTRQLLFNTMNEILNRKLANVQHWEF